MKTELVLGLLTGFIFGILLQRSETVRYDRQLGALKLKDFTILKFMLSTITVGMIGTYFLFDLDIVKLSIKPTVLGALLPGGILFGIGWALLGYCPGTSLGAIGEGRLDAIWGILGMLSGAALYAEAYPFLQRTILVWGDLGKITIPQILGTSHWIIIGIFVALVLIFFRYIERKGL
ncbi:MULTISPECIES: YeeE/YedE thiosulfate transporter family protein [Aminobacterium]|uniref:YeeE/YedE thiosulfate transporter family protein n=1 Tax=Aminobacterium TaxID=81466 RepID=UPI00046682E3|nr:MULTISPECIES: YeeE/YedE thiosulfate transporter family protein [Aminobacterium]